MKSVELKHGIIRGLILALACCVILQSAPVGAQDVNNVLEAADQDPQNALYVDDAGRVAIRGGITEARATLDVNGPDARVARFGVPAGQDARIGIATDGVATISFISQDGILSGPGHSSGVNAIRYDRPNGWLSLRTSNQQRLVVAGSDAVSTRIGIASDSLATISFLAQDGTLTGPGHSNGVNAIQYDRPNGWLSLRTGNKPRLTVMGSDSTATRVGIYSDGLATLSFISQDGKLSGGGTESGINAIQYDRGSGLLALRTNNKNQLTVNQNGTTTVKVLEITGGSDLAEPFAVSGASAAEPGTVVAIDPDHPGHLRVADSAYDSLVAGVVSGAGEFQPGLILNQGEIAEDTHPVALTGRVYVKAVGPIEVGDLLTTSEVPGHAMAATDRDRAFGATLGKAMSALDEGTGLVLVLVALQ